MAIFCYKKIKEPVRLSELFKQKRTERGWDLEKIPFRTASISFKHLRALEEGNFFALPRAKAYRLAYVRDYAQILGLDPENCVRQFCYENGLEDIELNHPKHHIKPSFFASWSTLIRNVLLGSLVCLFVGYLTWQIKGILEPPKLVVSSPTDGYITKELSTLIQGETEQGSRLLINGQETTLNNKGQFSIKLNLVVGLNTITISTTKKHGKTTKKTLYVIVKPNMFSSGDNYGKQGS